jgi:hypothetical protein
MLPNAMAPVFLKLQSWQKGPLGRQLRRGYKKALLTVGRSKDAAALDAGEDPTEKATQRRGHAVDEIVLAPAAKQISVVQLIEDGGRGPL